MMRRVAGLVAVFLLLGLAADAAPADSKFHVYFIDVMGGAATLVVTPAGESVLIDSGWPGQDDRDPKRIEQVVKEVAGLDHLDHLVTTHWHIDHFGGVEGLARRLRIDHYWDRGLPDPSVADGDRARYPDGPKAGDPLGTAYRKASEGKRRTLGPGDTLPLKGDVKALVVAASGRVIEVGAETANPACDDAPADLPADPSDNARSIALRFRCGDFDFLACGDLTWNVEKQLVCPRDRVGKVDLYLVTHHGLAISNHPTLLRTIAPTVTVMNNGPRKGGEARTVARIRALEGLEAAYQLHKNAATSDSDNTTADLIANPPGKQGEFIQAEFVPGGDSFTVRIGRDGPARRFPVR